MQKPTSLAIRDFRLDVCRAANTSGLPASVLEPVLYKIYQELQVLSEQERAADMEAYKKACEEGEDSGNCTENSDRSVSKEPAPGDIGKAGGQCGSGPGASV